MFLFDFTRSKSGAEGFISEEIFMTSRHSGARGGEDILSTKGDISQMEHFPLAVDLPRSESITLHHFWLAYVLYLVLLTESDRLGCVSLV